MKYKSKNRTDGWGEGDLYLRDLAQFGTDGCEGVLVGECPSDQSL